MLAVQAPVSDWEYNATLPKTASMIDLASKIMMTCRDLDTCPTHLYNATLPKTASMIDLASKIMMTCLALT
ncbi:unnamed protein product [Coffea canephora]|uniref:DH200=94 genomic scaffold, scaffold_1012 n=1 Tax=Coffea canephora TaxID=49390 RepID=A0A068VI45_COFCA|nr:unnamed protein product [Coffea canephora]